MTCKFTRTALALTLALGLAGCGGGKADFPINGTVTGLIYDGLVLNTNGMNLPVAKASTTFSFPNALSYGEAYAVTALPMPQHQTCVVTNGSDTAGRLAAINISVVCAPKQSTISGTISTTGNMTTAGLVLTNGSSGGTVTLAAGATAFTFAAPVSYGVSYGVTVLSQPAGATCTVAPNGTGIMGDDAIPNIAVNCVAN